MPKSSIRTDISSREAGNFYPELLKVGNMVLLSPRGPLLGASSDRYHLGMCRRVPSVISHVQGVVSQVFDLFEQFSENILPAQKFTLKHQEVAVTP